MVVLSNGAVARCCVLMQGKYNIPSKCTFFRILHQNRVQNIIQRHDNNI